MPELYGGGGFGLGLYSAEDVIDFDALTTYYINLLIIQYFTRARARATVGVMVQENVASEIVKSVQESFDLETAVGVQLDILATYRGATRAVFGLDLSHEFFAMPFYGDPDLGFFGFAFYGDTPSWFWLLYADTNAPVYAMNDDELRRLVKLRAKTQSRVLSMQEVDSIIFEFFGTNLSITDNGDMTVTYTHDLGDPDTLYKIAKGTNSLPKAAGVEIIYVD